MADSRDGRWAPSGARIYVGNNPAGSATICVGVGLGVAVGGKPVGLFRS